MLAPALLPETGELPGREAKRGLLELFHVRSLALCQHAGTRAPGPAERRSGASAFLAWCGHGGGISCRRIASASSGEILLTSLTRSKSWSGLTIMEIPSSMQVAT